MSWLGARPPKWIEVLGPATLQQPVFAGWPLHVKRVPTISLRALEQLPGGTATLERLQQATKWLVSDDAYSAVATTTSQRTPATSLSDEFVDQLVSHGIIAPVARADIRGHVNVFGIPEFAKQRIRCIKEPRDINRVIGKDKLMKLRFPTKADICGLVHKGKYFIALDFASYYDQFPFSEDVSRRFCFRKCNAYYRLLKLAAGLRGACEAAHCSTERMLDFDPTCATEAIMDNVIFVHDDDAIVIADTTTFVDRVKQVNGLLNEDVSDIAALVQTAGDWGGIHLDFIAKTSSLTPKIVDKAHVSWLNRGNWTWRQLAAHIGLLFWSWNIIDIPIYEFFALLRFISETGRWLTEHHRDWDAPARVWPSAWPDLEHWTTLVLRNQPRKVPQQTPPEYIVATDASEWGWGYFAVHNRTGTIHTFGAPWTPAFRGIYGDRLGVSTFTEPQAVVNACCHLLDPRRPVRVRIATDNTVTEAAIGRGYSTRSYHINECLRRLRQIFSADFVFDATYLPGELNPADPLSRGVRIANRELDGDHDMSAALRRYAGFAEPPGQSERPARGAQFAATAVAAPS